MQRAFVFALLIPAIGCAPLYSERPLYPDSAPVARRPVTISVDTGSPEEPAIEDAVRRSARQLNRLYAQGFVRSRVLTVLYRSHVVDRSPVTIQYNLIGAETWPRSLPQIDDHQLLLPGVSPVIAIPLPDEYNRICLTMMRENGHIHTFEDRAEDTRLWIRSTYDGPVRELRIQRVSPNRVTASFGCVSL